MVAIYRHLAVLLVISAACAKPPASAGAEPSAATQRVSRNPNVISEEELHDPLMLTMDAAAAIRRLRPSFFRTSGPQSFGDASAGAIQISENYGPLQPLRQLSTFGTMPFVEVRYLDINDATNRFGINANGGPVIVLLTRKN